MDVQKIYDAIRKTFNSVIAKRFVRAFIYGGLSAVGVALEAGANILQPKAYLTIIGIAFLTGGLLAIDKWIRAAIAEYLKNNSGEIDTSISQ